MFDKNQDLNVGDNSKVLQAGRDAIDNSITVNVNIDSEDTEITIIDEIFKGVLDNIKPENNPSIDKTFINAEKKIALNFRDCSDSTTVASYLQYAYRKLSLIEQRIQLEDPEVQLDLHSHILGLYSGFKRTCTSNIQILECLFDEFTPKNKMSNPQYTSLAKAFVLFFFDDCTIFEKTPEEKNKQQTFNFG